MTFEFPLRDFGDVDGVIRVTSTSSEVLGIEFELPRGRYNIQIEAKAPHPEASSGDWILLVKNDYEKQGYTFESGGWQPIKSGGITVRRLTPPVAASTFRF